MRAFGDQMRQPTTAKWGCALMMQNIAFQRLWRSELAVSSASSARGSRFAVAQDARGGDPGPTTTGNPRNVGLTDINQMAAVLHGEAAVFADAGYTGADKRPEPAERDVSWNIPIKRSIINTLP